MVMFVFGILGIEGNIRPRMRAGKIKKITTQVVGGKKNDI
jgi:hypothetical protein